VPSLASSTVGLVGTGRVGSAVARRLAAFGVRVLAYDPFANAGALAELGVTLVDLDVLLEESDAVSLHAPATPSTHHIIDRRALARLRPSAVLVNTARGSLVDSDALAEALTSGALAAAALDVVEPEPLPPHSPLWTAPNLTITPHVSFYSTESLARLERLAAEEAERALLGQPLRCPIP
jgi:D-3-phosphoglycerate dehydrogenase